MEYICDPPRSSGTLYSLFRLLMSRGMHYCHYSQISHAALSFYMLCILAERNTCTFRYMMLCSRTGHLHRVAFKLWSKPKRGLSIFLQSNLGDSPLPDTFTFLAHSRFFVSLWHIRSLQTAIYLLGQWQVLLKLTKILTHRLLTLISCSISAFKQYQSPMFRFYHLWISGCILWFNLFQIPI